MFLKTILLVLFLISSAVTEDVYVTITNGQIKGTQKSTYGNTVFYAFQQIPYAKPPTGDLRFMAPEPVENWDGLLDATVNDKICYQTIAVTDYTETEDCLYVNVYTPVEPSSEASIPVMFYIFGGGFIDGHPMYKDYGPHYFMDEGVIVVTVSYRTGPFGFMTTGDRVLPGNMGLKDQSLALKWVRDNIQYFGGDPEKVTIFGLSAGGASVTLQTLSQQSEGLFRAAISESGSALCPWAYQRNYKEIAYGLATYLDSSFNTSASSEELLAFLQTKTAEEIIKSTAPWIVGKDQMAQGFMFTPVVEPDHEGAFLTRRMYDAVESHIVSPVPLLIGITSEEQILRAVDVDSFQTDLGRYDADLGLLVNDNMHIVNNATKAVVGEAIKNIYTTDLLQNDIPDAVKYFSDTCFSRSIMHHAKLHSQYNDVYFYQFSYRGNETWNTAPYIEGCGRVNHGEDNIYLWAYDDKDNIEEWGTSRDALATRRYVSLFTNFAKNLNPTPEASEIYQNIIWPKMSEDSFQYLNIDDDLEIKTDPKGEIYTKWVELYENLAVKPYDTF